jgi:hypothetical protein
MAGQSKQQASKLDKDTHNPQKMYGNCTLQAHLDACIATDAPTITKCNTSN